MNKSQPFAKDQAEDAHVKDLKEDETGVSVEDKAAMAKLFKLAKDDMEDSTVVPAKHHVP